MVLYDGQKENMPRYHVNVKQIHLILSFVSISLENANKGICGFSRNATTCTLSSSHDIIPLIQ